MDPDRGQTARLVSERVSVFRRSLRGLPDGMLAALAAGLEKHRGELVTGRLYKSRKGGGCIVGVMLREWDPAHYEHGPLRFWLIDRWRRRSASYRGPLGRNPRLRHIEWTFDAAVAELRASRPDLTRRQACAAVGEAFHRAVHDEIGWRSVRAAAAASDLDQNERGPRAVGAGSR